MIQNKITEIEFPFFNDERGQFIKTFNKQHSILGDYEIKQANFVVTNKPLTLRGLHFQESPYWEEKLFKVIDGRIIILACNLSNLNYPKYYYYQNELSQSTSSIFIPEGFATGYLTLEKNSKILYFSNQDYKPDYENGIKYNDFLLKFELPTIKYISDKDKSWKDISTLEI